MRGRLRGQLLTGACGCRSHSDTRVGCMVSSTTPAARAQAVQIDLVAQPDAERLDGPGGVVAAAVEAPVDPLLDAAAGRLEHRRHGQGGPRHDQAGTLGQQPAQPQHHRGVPQAHLEDRTAVDVVRHIERHIGGFVAPPIAF